jgi:hypothetical protein
MSMLLRLMNEVDRYLRNYHVEDVNRRGGQGPRQEGLTAEPLQRQKGGEDEGFIPEGFGLSVQVAVVATHLLEPGWDRHFGFTESVETLPRVVVVSGVIRRLVVVGIIPADRHEKYVATSAWP